MKLINSSAKTNWKYITIAVVVVSLVIPILWYIGFLIEHDTLIPKPRIAPPIPQQIKNNETQDQEQEQNFQSWQTYRSDEFGFEVRYPEGWEALEVFKENFGVVIKIRKLESGSSLSIWKNENKANLSFDSWMAKFAKTREAQQSTTLNGLKAYRVEFGMLSFHVYISNNKNQIFTLSVSGQDDKDLVILGQILSTFRFTPPAR